MLLTARLQYIYYAFYPLFLAMFEGFLGLCIQSILCIAADDVVLKPIWFKNIETIQNIVFFIATASLTAKQPGTFDVKGFFTACFLTDYVFIRINFGIIAFSKLR